MSDPIPLQTPGGFVPGMANGFDDGTGHFAFVGASRPLPVQSTPPPVPEPLEGSSASDVLAGPFTPSPLSPVFCTLSGDWQGSVQIKRSTDGGATLHPLSLAGASWGRFARNVCEPVWEEAETGASLWLDCAITSGTLAYRLAQ